MPRVLALAASFLIAVGAGTPGLAQSGSGGGDKALEVPGGDIFGFSDPTDTGDKGERGLSLELTSLAGKQRGTYFTPTLKTKFETTPAENLAVSVAAWTTGFRIAGVPDLDDRSQARFDGLSSEAVWRFLERSETNPVAAALAFEPRWARVDGVTGEAVDAFSGELKLLVDTVLVPDRLYAALNLNVAPGVQRSRVEPFAQWTRSSTTNVSGALTYRATERVFVGAEARWLASYDGSFLNELAGHALFAGPTLAFKLSDTATFNVVWTPQVLGRASGGSGPLDLANFERHQFRLKFAMSL